jgi:putative ABC transport system permease protein
MFKNMLKRSWLSIIRKPSRAIIIGLVLFAMANLVLASLAIKGAVSESVAYAKSSLGGTVYLQPDLSKLRSQAQSSASSTGERPQITRPSVPMSTVKSIADSSYVKDYTYGVTTRADADGFTPITSTDTNQRSFGGFGGGQESSDTSAVSVEGINSYAFISQVSDGSMSISSGKYFDETTNNSVIISADLASADNLSVGGTIKLKNTSTNQEYTLTIIGIYDTTDSNFNANTIYMNVTTAANFLSTDEYNNGDYSVENVHYVMVDAGNADKFIAEANSKFPNLASDNLTLSINDTAYKQEVGPIEAVGSFATTILWIVVAASVVIITLIVTINVKDRRYEMGVLLSLGATKRNVIGQVFAELFIVATIAFAVSLVSSTFVAKAMGQGLLNSQTALSQQQSQNNFGRPTGGTTGGRFSGGFGGGMGGQTTTNTKAISTIDVTASAFDYLILFAVGYGIVILSLVIPSWNIVKYQPKTILAGKE